MHKGGGGQLLTYYEMEKIHFQRGREGIFASPALMLTLGRTIYFRLDSDP
jgi:hypothetical protein